MKMSPRLKIKRLTFALACAFATPLHALPTDMAVVQGSVGMTQNAHQMVINNSNASIIHWGGFSIGAGETVRFNQSSAASSVLNRVVGKDPSQILGRLESNGRVFLVNPAGIFVGQGASINVGSFVASTLNISNEDFLAGKMRFSGNAQSGQFRNEGAIQTPEGGQIYLLATQVENAGTIEASKGNVVLAAGLTVEIGDTASPGVRVLASFSDHEVANLGRIAAEAGAVGLMGTLIKNSGTVRVSAADDAVVEGGKIIFRASKNITQTADAKLEADGKKGGTIYLESGDTTLVEGSISAQGVAGDGGTVQVLGNKVALLDRAFIDASGHANGGTVLIGGDYQGQNSAVKNAQMTVLAPDALINANAGQNGNGGKVILWADDATRAYGTVSVRGGSESGDGGFVEVSGAQFLDFHMKGVDRRATNGKAGTLLLDPTDIEINNTASSGGSWNANIFSPPNTTSPATTISWTDIDTQLGLGDVIIQTKSTGTGTGGQGLIKLTAGGTLSNTHKLSLLAEGSIMGVVLPAAAQENLVTGGDLLMMAGWDSSLTNALLNPRLQAGNTNPNTVQAANSGTLVLSRFNVTSGGNIDLQAISALAINDGTLTTTGGNISLYSNYNPSNLTTGNRSIILGSSGAVAGASPVKAILNANGGNITLKAENWKIGLDSGSQILSNGANGANGGNILVSAATEIRMPSDTVLISTKGGDNALGQGGNGGNITFITTKPESYSPMTGIAFQGTVTMNADGGTGAGGAGGNGGEIRLTSASTNAISPNKTLTLSSKGGNATGGVGGNGGVVLVRNQGMTIGGVVKTGSAPPYTYKPTGAILNISTKGGTGTTAGTSANATIDTGTGILTLIDLAAFPVTGSDIFTQGTIASQLIFDTANATIKGRGMSAVGTATTNHRITNTGNLFVTTTGRDGILLTDATVSSSNGALSFSLSGLGELHLKRTAAQGTAMISGNSVSLTGADTVEIQNALVDAKVGALNLEGGGSVVLTNASLKSATTTSLTGSDIHATASNLSSGSGNISLSATGNTSLDDVFLSDTTVTSTGGSALFTLNGGNVVLTGTTPNGTNVTAQSLSVSGAGHIVLSKAKLNATTGALSLIGAGEITLDNANLLSGTTATLAANNLDLRNTSTLTSVGNLSLTATGGTAADGIFLTDSTLRSTGGSVVFALNGGDVVLTGTTTNGASVTAQSLSVSGAGHIVLSKAKLNATTGALSLIGAGEITLDNANLLSGTTATLAANNLDLRNASTLTSVGNLSLTTTGGTAADGIFLTDSTLRSTGGSVVFALNGGGVTLTGTTTNGASVTAQSVSVSGAGDIALTNASLEATTASLSLSGDKAFNFINTELKAVGDIALTSLGTTNVEGIFLNDTKIVSTGGAASFHLNGGNAIFSGSTPNDTSVIAKEVSVSGAGEISLIQTKLEAVTGALSLTGTEMMTLNNANLRSGTTTTLEASSLALTQTDLRSGGNLLLTATDLTNAGSIGLLDSTIISTGGSATFRLNGDFTVLASAPPSLGSQTILAQGISVTGAEDILMRNTVMKSSEDILLASSGDIHLNQARVDSDQKVSFHLQGDHSSFSLDQSQVVSYRSKIAFHYARADGGFEANGTPQVLSDYLTADSYGATGFYKEYSAAIPTPINPGIGEGLDISYNVSPPPPPPPPGINEPPPSALDFGSSLLESNRLVTSGLSAADLGDSTNDTHNKEAALKNDPSGAPEMCE